MKNPGITFLRGATGGKYSTTSLTRVLKKAAEKANISKRVHPHLLCHSIATHLIGQGVDISVVQ